MEKHKRTKHSVDFPCNMCKFQAMNTDDLGNHRRAKHGPQFPCDFCTYKASHNPDLNRHMKGMHPDKFNRSTVFTNQSRNNNNKINENVTNAKEKTTEENIYKDEEHNADSVLNGKFNCVGPCGSLQKNFSHKDELELHMKYFHKEQPQPNPQPE